MLLSSDCDIKAAEDGSFLLKTGLADYRIRIGSGAPSLTRGRFHEDPRFFSLAPRRRFVVNCDLARLYA